MDNHMGTYENRLRKQTWKGAAQRYGATLSTLQRKRIQHELEALKSETTAWWLITLQEAINKAKKAGIFIGPGWGAAAGSIVNYCLGITEVDPLMHGLLFERYVIPLTTPIIDIEVGLGNEESFKQLLKERQHEHVGNSPIRLLELKALSQTNDIIELIRIKYQKSIDLTTIPLDDKEVLRRFAFGDTHHFFGFESETMRHYLKRLQPACFNQICSLNALFRPGTEKWIEDFIKRRETMHPIKYTIRELDNILGETYGLLIYQEQLIHIGITICGMTAQEANQFRLAIQKKTRLPNEVEQLFIEGGMKKGHDQTTLLNVWKDLEKKATFTNLKSHIVCHTLIAYRLAWLRVYYTNEFDTVVA